MKGSDVNGMNNQKQYHGYLALPRHAILLRQELGYNLFNLYIALVMLARWHRSNPQIGCVIGTQTEIAKHIGKSQSIISRGLKALEPKGNKKFIIRHSHHVVLGFFPLFLTDVADKMHSNNYANLHELYADMYRINSELQDNYAISQVKRGQKPTQSLYSSFKVDYGSFDRSEDISTDEVIKSIEDRKNKEGGL